MVDAAPRRQPLDIKATQYAVRVVEVSPKAAPPASGATTRMAKVATRDTEIATHEAGVATRDTKVATHRTGAATREAGVATR